MQKPFKTKKALGQHFLRDQIIIDRMILAIKPDTQQHFIEIGPGQGALTCALLPHIKQLDVIEYDRSVIPYLKQNCEDLGQLHVHESDVLQFDFKSFFEKNSQSYRIVGNLPYNISTPIFFHLMPQIIHMQDMHFMVQKEVAERVVAKPGSKIYGRLSVMMQYYCRAILLFEVPPRAFLPPPKVDSAVIRLLPHGNKMIKANNEILFANLVRDCFNLRRKTLRNSVKSYINTQLEASCPIDLGLRPENLSVSDFVCLADFIDSLSQHSN
ncbi:MAG: 16S rRNA (adenine(1518)-N(6)/adenine(1519)-N(6))-dimethyltransferase [Legionellales bacterium]|nr:16S rRNA (adenine(1518)-N(6)/adenine(1519)-N(6))-dimethyltransferase [Legionellales bacterium]|tara:strand:- start:604 stop:1410 length:807 start_codon:yes stop_codon:yes gene_type:complete